MSANSCCQENTMAESFFSNLKQKLGLDDEAKNVNRPMQLTRQQAFWIDGYYNRKRRHSTVGYLSRIDYKEQFTNTRTLSCVMP